MANRKRKPVAPASWLETTRGLLDEAVSAGVPLLDIANGAGVSYWWVQKFWKRSSADPGVVKVQALHDYLRETRGPPSELRRSA